jgi:hypothetical protein
MAKQLDDAKLRWDNVKSRFSEKRNTRVAYLGDGGGYATSNMYVPSNQAYVYARESHQTKNAFPVLNRNRVRPSFDIPVVLGYTEDDPDHEQVLSIHYASLDFKNNASILGGTGPHNLQHQFGGGDEVFIDSRLFQPGLVKPTNPPSMIATIQSFVYYYNSWRRFTQATTDDLTEYIHASKSRFILIALDPTSNSIVYRIGNLFSASLWSNFYETGENNGFSYIPAPSGDEMPLAAVYLAPNTTQINWNAATTDNLYDMRLHIGFSNRSVLDRLFQIEGLTGNRPNLAMTGAADSVADEFPNIIDGGVF